MEKMKKSPKKVVVMLLSVVLIILFGIGMYYLGSEQDKRSNEAEIERLTREITTLKTTVEELNATDHDVVDNQIEPEIEKEDDDDDDDDGSEIADKYLFRSAHKKTTFEYPVDWVVTSVSQPDTDEIENVKTYYVTSPYGSRLIYSEADYLSPFGVEMGCDENDPKGIYSDNLFSCVFVGEDDDKFARYKDLEIDVDEGEWYVAENTDDESFYVHFPGDSFTYEVKHKRDLDVLDQMILSVERSD